MKKNITIIIMALIILILMSFILFNALNKNNKNTNKPKIEKTPEADLITDIDKNDEEIMAKMIEKFDEIIISYYPISDFNQIANSHKLLILAYDMINSNKKTFTKDEIKEQSEKLFSKKLSYKDENIINKYDDIIYKYENGIYSKVDIPPHSGCPNGYRSYYIDGKYNKTKNIYSLNYKTLFGGICIDKVDSLIDYMELEFYDSIKRDNAVYKIDVDDASETITFDEVYKKVYKKLKTTTYNFIKENESFKLLNVEINQKEG